MGIEYTRTRNVGLEEHQDEQSKVRVNPASSYLNQDISSRNLCTSHLWRVYFDVVHQDRNFGQLHDYFKHVCRSLPATIVERNVTVTSSTCIPAEGLCS